jgi:two-component system sensor histidine kinase/response regulator
MKQILPRLLRHFVVACFVLSVHVAAQSGSALIDLSTTEQAWLREHPVIRLAPDPNFAPIEWFNQNGDYNGITSDYVVLLQERLGIQFEIVRDHSWNDILEKARTGEVDALSAVIHTTEREQHLTFTKPYFIAQRALFSARELEGIKVLGDLAGYKIAVVQGSWMDETLGANPNMSINRFQDLSTALIATSLGATDVTGSALETMSFIRHQEGLTNLETVTVLPNDMALSFAVNNSLSPLAGILDKALDSISPVEAERIRTRWIQTTEPHFWEKPVYQYSAFGLLTLLLAAMAAVLTWNRMLKARVQERGKQLYEANMQLIQAEKMESVGRLSAGVAHEVKNPLAIIQMGADYLRNVIPPEDDAHEVLADIDNAVQRADLVIRDLLDYSHNDELELCLHDLNNVVEEALRMVGHEFTRRDIATNVHLSPDNPPIKIDTNKIQQVLINMLMNAAQAIEKDGQVSVSCSVARFDGGAESAGFHLNDPVLRLTIGDSGPGISEDDLVRLFDPFFTTKPVGEGTGLGLSVSRNIIELHSGRLDICNGPTGGALVTMDFKLEEKH